MLTCGRILVGMPSTCHPSTCDLQPKMDYEFFNQIWNELYNTPRRKFFCTILQAVCIKSSLHIFFYKKLFIRNRKPSKIAQIHYFALNELFRFEV